jgi:magnesium transporter
MDLVEPTREELDAVARRYGLPATAVQDCLDPEHLPKYERFDGTAFLILRAYDERCTADADTIQALTRKVAIFWGSELLLTIHRKDQPYLDAIMGQWKTRLPAVEDGATLAASLVVELAHAVVQSYEPPLVEAESRIDAFEAELLRQGQLAVSLPGMYNIKRRVTLAARLLLRTVHMSVRLPANGPRDGSLIQDLKENAESMHFYADELLQDVNNLLSMQLALAAHRTNEVVKVLTVFSAFFLPLTFIVGVYGMNFEYMPELSLRVGYPAVLLFMFGLVTVIWIWFRRRGWM